MSLLDNVNDAIAAITAALEEAAAQTEPQRWRVNPQEGDNIQCPAVVIGPPALTFGSGVPEPTDARFLVYLVVDGPIGRELATLLELAPFVFEAIDTQTDGVVVQADPATYVVGADLELPAYEIVVEVPL